ncbi:MAG: carboxypeptidase-like regulatory domain-containing protein [Bacteroidota bacterium]
MFKHTALLCGLLLTLTLEAGAQLNLATQMDPNPSPYISDWRNNPNVLRFIVTNSTGADVEVRFVGYIEGEARGKVAETIDDSPIPPVVIPPGTTVFSAVDIGILEEGSVLYTGPTSEETKRSGRLPEDNFRICVRLQAYGPPYNLLTPESCSRFTIRLIMPPTLIAPLNNNDVKTAPGFQWSVVPLGTGKFARYEITVVELAPGQTNYAQAIKSNIPLIQRETNIAMYQILPADPELEKGSSYAWQVRAFDLDDSYTFANQGYSDVWTFLYDPVVPPGFDGKKLSAGGKGTSKSVKPDLSHLNTQANFVFAGMTRLQGTLLTTFYKNRIPEAKSVTIHDPKPGTGKPSSSQSQQGKPPTGTKPATGGKATPGSTKPGSQVTVSSGIKASTKLGNVFFLNAKQDLPLGGIHLKLYRYVRTVPICGIYPFAAGGKSYSSEELVATATTKDDGSFEFVFFSKDSTGRILKNAAIHSGGSGDVGVCDFTGDLYRYYIIRVADPHLCSPDDEFAVQPGETKDIGTVYSLVRSYNVTVQVRDQKDTTQLLPGMNVLLIRRNRPYDVPPNEGTLDPHEPAAFPFNSEIIGRGETDADGLCTFKHVAKSVGAGDYYDLWITNPDESVYWYATRWQTFRFSFLLYEKDELGNGMVWDQTIHNAGYDPEIMHATVNAGMYPKNPRVKGRVFRADNRIQPLANTFVSLYRKSQTLTCVAFQKTNDSGGFIFDNLLPTEGEDYYYLKFEKYGYKKHQEPPNLQVDQIKLKKGRQRSFPGVLLEPKLVVHGKIIDEFGRPVAATIRIGTGLDEHTVKHLKPLAVMPIQPQLMAATMQVNPNIKLSATAQRVKFTTKKAAVKLVKKKISYDEVFTSAAPTGLQQIFIMPDNIELYHCDTLMMFLPEGTEDLGEFVVYVKAHRLAVRAISLPPPPPPAAPKSKVKSSKKSSQIAAVAQQTPPKTPGSMITQSTVAGGAVQMSFNQFMISLGTSLIVKGCSITVNGEEADSVDANNVHYFIWFSPGDDAEIAVEGPSDKDYVPKTVTATIEDETPAWHEMNIPMELGGRLSGTVMVGAVPIPGARVALYDNPSETEPQQTYTDAAGKYTIRGLRAEMHTFLAAKSKSQFIGDTASIGIAKGQESILDFELTAYNDMDITSLLGFPIEVTALDSGSGVVTISGTFIELPSNTQFAPEDSSKGIPFANIGIAATTEMNPNGIPYAEPTVLPLVTPVNSWDIGAFGGLYKATQKDQTNGVRVRRTDERGEIIGAVAIKSSSFSFPGGSLDLGSTNIALSMAPGTPEGMIIPAITSDAGPASTLPQGFYPLGEDGSALHYELYDFQTSCDSMRSYFHDDTLSLATVLHTNIENIATPDLAVDIGALRVHHNDVENNGSGEELQVSLEGDWKIISRSWTLDQNGLSLDSGTIRAGFLGVPFKGLQIFPDQIAFGDFDLDRLIMSGVAEIFITGDTQFGFDPGTMHWSLSVGPKTVQEDECGWMMPIFPMDPNDRIRFNNFYLQSSGAKGFTMKPGAIVTLSKVGQYVINQFFPKEDYIQIAGSLDLGIPNLPMINHIAHIREVDDEILFQPDAINETISVNGVKIKFKTAKGEQDWQVGGLHSGVNVYEEGAFNLDCMLHHTPAKTEVIVNEAEVVEIGTEVSMTDVVGEMHVADAAWELFWFEGDLQNKDQGGRLKFTVQGDIVADGQSIGVDKIETPFGDISLIYNFQEQQLEGTLHVEQDLSGVSIVGDATLLVSGAGKGWYFFVGATFELPAPKIDGTCAFAVGNFKLTQKQLDQFAAYSYNNVGLPQQFHNFNGFFFEGTVKFPPPFPCPNFDFDFGIVRAYMICQIGVNCRFGMNFGPVDTYFIAIRALGQLEAGVGLSVVIACSGVSAGVILEAGFEGIFQSNGNWSVMGDFGITLYGSAYAGWGICDANCEGSLCDKESVSASMKLGVRGTMTQDGSNFEIYFE